MAQVTKKMALEYHEEGRPGKIEITPTKPYQSQLDLSLAYSPGVAYPCLEIEKDPADAYKYTNKGNLVAVISNGTAVLGLGNIGALAGKPVMEGKALLFKIFAGLDSFDIEVNEHDPDKFVEIVKALTPTFGGINLEDIKAPECFEIERRLKEECNIPIMHDDQHGTAIISAAGLINALDLQQKKIGDVRLVVNGAGAAAISCTKLYMKLGIRRDNIVMCDSKGVIREDRIDLNPQKREFATSCDIHTLADAMKDADVFLGLSVADVVTPDMVKSMAPRPILFALANPDPEISYETAMECRSDIIVATGRSDYPNQINNVLGFPYIFRGALDCGATGINEDMKIAAAHAIARLARQPVPEVVDKAYGSSHIKFGKLYILPKALDPRLLTTVAPAVAEAAEKSGIALRPIKDMEAYRLHLQALMGHDVKFMRRITDLAKRKPMRVVFSQADNDNMLHAVHTLSTEKICIPVLLGNKEMILKRAAALGLDLDNVEIINPRHDNEAARRLRYADVLAETMGRQGYTKDLALEKLHDRVYFGMMMVRQGDADAMIDGIYSAANDTAALAKQIIGIRPGYDHFATMHIMSTRRGMYFLADTGVNAECDTDTLVDITRLVNDAACFFGEEAVIAMLSYSNFGSNSAEADPRTCAVAVEILHEKYPQIAVDGEMQVNYALNTDLRDKTYPFNKIKGRKVNTLVFPNLLAANTAYKILLEMGLGQVTGPISVGLNKPVNFISIDASPRDIVDLAAIVSVNAAVIKENKEDCNL